jgi:hypothetical protein
MAMRNLAFFRDYLRVLSAQVSYVETSRQLNISSDWVFKVIRDSKAAAQRGDAESIFLFKRDEDGDEGAKWFHEHCRACVSNSIEAIEAASRCRALNGTTTVAKFQGRTIYQLAPDLIPLDDETLAMIGLSDRYLRDPITKKLVPETVWTPPRSDEVAMVLAAHSRAYRKNSTVDVNMRAQIGGGVVVIGRAAAPVLAAPLLPVLEIVQEAVADDGPLASDEQSPPDDDLAADDDIAATDTPADDLAEDDVDPALEPQPAERVSRIPTPDEYMPTPNPLIAPPRAGRALSPLEKDLLSRLPGALDRSRTS